MKDCFKTIEQEDEAKVRFKQRVVGVCWRLMLYQDLGRVRGMAKDKLAHKDVQR